MRLIRIERQTFQLLNCDFELNHLEYLKNYKITLSR